MLVLIGFFLISLFGLFCSYFINEWLKIVCLFIPEVKTESMESGDRSSNVVPIITINPITISHPVSVPLMSVSSIPQMSQTPQMPQMSQRPQMPQMPQTPQMSQSPQMLQMPQFNAFAPINQNHNFGPPVPLLRPSPRRPLTDINMPFQPPRPRMSTQVESASLADLNLSQQVHDLIRALREATDRRRGRGRPLYRNRYNRFRR